MVIDGCSYCKTIFLGFLEPQETPKYAYADIQTKNLWNTTAEKIAKATLGLPTYLKVTKFNGMLNFVVLVFSFFCYMLNL